MAERDGHEPIRPRYEVTIRKMGWGRHLWAIIDTDSARLVAGDVELSDDKARRAAVKRLDLLLDPQFSDLGRVYTPSELKSEQASD